MKTLNGKVVLVTGSSRGVGAQVATLLAGMGANVVINYRQRAPLAAKVAAAIEALGATAMTVRADLTEPVEVRQLLDDVAARFGRLDVLILNASGGLERNRPPGYAMRLNTDAQIYTTQLALKLMPRGSRIVFVTSHHAHFYGERPTIPEYEAVAASKKAGETALRALIPELNARGISLIVVSGDVIDRTVTANFLERARPQLFAARRVRLGRLLSVADFAGAVADAARNADLASGTTIYMGSTTQDAAEIASNAPAQLADAAKASLGTERSAKCN